MERNTNTLYITRFVASIMVVLTHYVPLTLRNDFYFFTKNGAEAVNFFFFLSGFVMVVANQRFMTIAEIHKFPKFDFYAKRIARIYPLYLLALLLLVLFHYLIHPIDSPSLKYRFIFEVFGIQRWLYAGSINYPGWTISCEFFFYLMFPYLFKLLVTYWSKAKLLIPLFSLFTLMLNTYLFQLNKSHLPDWEHKIVSLMLFHPVLLISVFICGMLCGKLYVEGTFSAFKNNNNNRIIVVLSIVAIFASKYFLPHEFSLLKSGLLIPVYFVFVIAITSFTNPKEILINKWFFIFLGEISYGIYILQYPVFVFYNHFISAVSTKIHLAGFVVSLILTATLTYYLIERTFKEVILKYYNKKRLMRENVI